MAFGYDGSIRIDTKINQRGFNQGISSMTSALGKLAGAIGIAFGVAAVVNFGRESVKAASQLSSAMIGLQSIMEGQGRSFQQAQGFIQDYIKDGLIPMENAVTAYKNLAQRGYSTEQIEKTLVALKDAAAFGRQASYSMGDAVSSATEGLRNENSILVDNAGVTKNVAKMWDDYAKSIGTTANNLTQQQKIQAEVNGILEESKYQVGDAAKVTNTYAGQVAMLSFNFQQLKVAVGNAVIPIAKAIIPGINSIISALTQLANTFAQVTTLLFGDQNKAQEDLAASGNAAADASDNLAGSTEDVGNSAEKTKKQLEKSLAGFDKINKLADKTADSMEDVSDGLDMSDKLPGDVAGGELWGGVTISPDVEAAVNKFKGWLDEIQVILSGVWDVFAESWNKNGAGVIEAAKTMLLSIIGVLGDIGTAFAQVWTNGTGSEILDAIYSIITGIMNVVSELANRFREAWAANDNGVQIWQSILNIIQLVVDFVNRLVQATIVWAQGLNLEPLVSAFKNLLQALEPLIDIILNGLSWAYENVLLPLASWLLEEYYPAWLDVLAATFNALYQVLDALRPAAQWLWENFLKPLAEFTGDLFIAAFEAVTDALNDFASWVSENKEVIQQNIVDMFIAIGDAVNSTWNEIIKPVLDAFAQVFGDLWESLSAAWETWGSPIFEQLSTALEGTLKLLSNAWENIIKPIIDKIGEVLSNLWENHLKPLIDSVLDFVGAFIEAFLAFYNSFVLPIKSALQETIGPIFVEVFSAIADVVGTVFGTIADVASGIITALTGVLEFLTGVFTGDWDKAWGGIAKIFTGVFNGIVGVLEGAVNLIIHGINWLIQQLNKLNVDMPDWISENFGISSIGFNIPEIQELKIPRLATGAVIPPNRQFAAILGDQRSGTNIEAPLSTIEQAVTNAIQKSGYSGGAVEVNINFSGDLAQFARIMYPEIERVSRFTGNSLIDRGI